MRVLLKIKTDKNETHTYFHQFHILESLYSFKRNLPHELPEILLTKLTLYILLLDLADATQISQNLLKCHHGDVDKTEMDMEILSNMLLSSLILYLLVPLGALFQSSDSDFQMSIVLAS